MTPEPNTGTEPLKLLFLSTAAAPLGSGEGGGVELSVQSLSTELAGRGHSIDILAPVGSRLSEAGPHRPNQETRSGPNLITLPGRLEPKAQHLPRSWQPEPLAPGSFLSRACRETLARHASYDLILNFSYDLPILELTEHINTPLAHLISMGSLYDRFDRLVGRLARNHPGYLACYSRSQAASFPRSSSIRPLGFGLDLERYRFSAGQGGGILWMGRISPEKGLEDAFEVAESGRFPLRVAGKLENGHYWEELIRQWPDADVNYLGFLPTDELQREIGRSSALLMTPKWEEAFGIVAVEALACGTPVISYRRGGPAEIIDHTVTGYLTDPDRPEGLLAAIRLIDRIDRRNCRRAAESDYSLTAWANRIETWFTDILSTGSTRNETGSTRKNTRSARRDEH